MGVDRIGHHFADATLLAQALTHRSASAHNNERLEFLGDGVINLLIAETLYTRWHKADEGALTRARAELVREAALAVIARKLELGKRLVMGPGEMKSGGHRRDSILADALEAIVAAIYLDAGFDVCRTVVLPWFEESLAALPVGRPEKDAKTRLQEWLQASQQPLPQYELVGESGGDHAKTFRARCSIDESTLWAEGEGNSRRNAEQAAAAALLELVKA
jgi:ribonuclease-3